MQALLHTTIRLHGYIQTQNPVKVYFVEKLNIQKRNMRSRNTFRVFFDSDRYHYRKKDIDSKKKKKKVGSAPFFRVGRVTPKHMMQQS